VCFSSQTLDVGNHDKETDTQRELEDTCLHICIFLLLYAVCTVKGKPWPKNETGTCIFHDMLLYIICAVE